VPRSVVVVESMAAVTILDLLFENMHSKISGIIDFYK
jgi:chorismate synthase